MILYGYTELKKRFQRVSYSHVGRSMVIPPGRFRVQVHDSTQFFSSDLILIPKDSVTL